ncbi:hypothetical protein AAHC03_026100 [Spirometra sp. Aus1]|nr:unnamed protein product [Spirometra erinaceieuropaei]
MAGLSTTAKIIKFVIVACNILSLLFGLAIFIVGILDLVLFESISEAKIMTISTGVAAGAIVLGFFIALVAFLGLFGALRASASVLIVYAVTVLLIGCSTLVLLIFTFVERDYIPKAVHDAVRATLQENMTKYERSEKWTAIIKWLESTFDCTAADYSPSAVHGKHGKISGLREEGGRLSCPEAVAETVAAELVTIGGCLIGITLLSFFASAMAFVLARDIKAYEKL